MTSVSNSKEGKLPDFKVDPEWDLKHLKDMHYATSAHIDKLVLQRRNLPANTRPHLRAQADNEIAFHKKKRLKLKEAIEALGGKTYSSTARPPKEYTRQVRGQAVAMGG